MDLHNLNSYNDSKNENNFNTISKSKSNPELIAPLNTFTRSPMPRQAGYYEDASTGLPTSRPGSANDAGWTGIDFGHINKDNNLDLVCIGRKGNGPEVFLGNGAGLWTKSNTGLTSSWCGRSDVRIVDINKDGNSDILSSDSDFWQGDGTGKWSSFSSPPFHGEDVDYGDFNNDNHLDVAIVGHLTGGVKAYFGYSNGTWLETNALPGAGSGSGGHKIAVGDVNNDGYDDIISTYWYSSSAWISDGSGNWTRNSTGIDQSTQFWGVDVGDINNDGNLDIVFGSYHSNSNPAKDGIRVYQGDGAGIWTERGSGIPTSGGYGPVRLADMDLDGNIDIIAGENGASGGVHLYLGDGNFSFSEIDNGLPKSTSDDQEGLDIGDIDGNGYLDVGIPYYGPTGVEVWKYVQPTPISLNITSPNGGEKFRAGTDLNITWSCTGGVSPVLITIELSTNGFAGPFYTINADFENTGYYNWKVDSVVSNDCFIRITAIDSCQFQQQSIDYSNDSFEIFMIPLDRVSISPENAVIHLNEIVEFRVHAFDTTDIEMLGPLDVEWSVSGGFGNFTQGADWNLTEFEPFSYGNLKVTAKVDYFIWSKNATASIFVPRIPVNIQFDYELVNLSNGQERSVTAFVFDPTGFNMTVLPDMGYTWELVGSNAQIIKGKNNNKVTIRGTEVDYGNLKLTAKYYNRQTSAEIPVNVFSALVSVLLNPQEIYTRVGQHANLSVYLYDLDNYQVQITPDVHITWSVIGDIGTVNPLDLEDDSVAMFLCQKVGAGWIEVTVDYYGDIFTNRTRVIAPQTLAYLLAEPDIATVYRYENRSFTVTGYDATDEEITGKLDYTWDLLYNLGKLLNGSDENSKILRPFESGSTILLVTAEYYGSKASVQIRIIVPPELNKLELSPMNPIIFKNSTQEFEVQALDQGGFPILENISFNWLLENNFGKITSLENPSSIVYLATVLGTGQIKVQVEHFNRVLYITSNLTVVQQLARIEITASNDAVDVGRSVIISARAFDDLGFEILEGVDFQWVTDSGKVIPINNLNSTIEYTTNTPGKAELLVIGRYYGVSKEATYDLQINKKDTEPGFFESTGTLLIIVITIIIITLIIFYTIKRRQKPEIDTGDEILVSDRSTAATVSTYTPPNIAQMQGGVYDYTSLSPTTMPIPINQPMPMQMQMPMQISMPYPDPSTLPQLQDPQMQMGQQNQSTTSDHDRIQTSEQIPDPYFQNLYDQSDVTTAENIPTYDIKYKPPELSSNNVGDLDKSKIKKDDTTKIVDVSQNQGNDTK
jgi:hypothetical protein